MDQNEMHPLEAKIISKTFTFLNRLNRLNDSDNKEKCFMEKKDNPNRDWINLYIKNSESYQVGIHYQRDIEKGKIIITGECPNRENLIPKLYKEFIVNEIPEIADRIKGY